MQVCIFERRRVAACCFAYVVLFQLLYPFPHLNIARVTGLFNLQRHEQSKRKHEKDTMW